MQHLDEGTVQAWLDRDRSGVGAGRLKEIEQHLLECSQCATRLREAEELSIRAGSILGSVQPSNSALPPFSEVMQRAGMDVPAPTRRPRTRRWIPLAWAASVAGAIGLGWWTNDLLRVQTVALGVTDAGLRSSEAALPSEAGPAAERDALSESPESISPTPVGGFAGVSDGLSEELQEAGLAEAEQPPQASPVAARMLASEEVREETGPVAATILRGVVATEDGEPLAGAEVLTGELGISAVTEADGTFSLSFPRGADPSESRTTVTATRLGYRGLAREVALGVADTVSAYFPLAEGTVALDETAATGGLGQARQRAASSLRADIMASGDSAGVPSEQATGAAVNWMITSLQNAETEAGFGVLTVPDLPVLEVALGRVDGAAAVRVRQSVSPGIVLTLMQRPETGAPADRAFSDADLSPDTIEVEAMVRDGVLVRGAAPRIPSDSVRLLLERVR